MQPCAPVFKKELFSIIIPILFVHPNDHEYYTSKISIITSQLCSKLYEPGWSQNFENYYNKLWEKAAIIMQLHGTPITAKQNEKSMHQILSWNETLTKIHSTNSSCDVHKKRNYRQDHIIRIISSSQMKYWNRWKSFLCQFDLAKNNTRTVLK